MPGTAPGRFTSSELTGLTIVDESPEAKASRLESDVIWLKQQVKYLTSRIKTEEDKNIRLEKRLVIVEAIVDYLKTLDEMNV
jgi:hypothetical protein